jgi:flagellar hook protein FlgE
MDVRSAYNSGLTGFQRASAQLNSSSSQIAQAGMAENTLTENRQASGDLPSSTERTPVSLTTELVNLKVAEYQAKAAAKVISTADEVSGTLINTSV